MNIKLILVIFVCGFCCCQAARASEDANDWRHPADWIELSGDFRFRFVYDNNRKLDNQAVGHERIQMRFRIRQEVKFKLTDDLDFNIRLITEPRYFIEAHSELHHWSYNEALFDLLNLTWRNAFNSPMTIVAGRQDIRLGSNWLIMDGTPLDGGRTGFFDALRFTYNWAAKDTTADFILIDNHADSAKWFEPFNDRDIDLSEQDEQGAILYLAKKTSKDSGIDLYFIYKHDDHRVISSGLQGEIYTLGTRFYGKLTEHWQYNLEVAPQFGRVNTKDFAAFAANNQLIYNFNDKKENRIYLGHEFLSGNKDPDKYFDRAWGRVDTWSVLYQGNTDTIDGKAYESSNLHRVYLDWFTRFSEKTDMKIGYALLFADKNTNKAGTGGLSKNGKFRGQLGRVLFTYKPVSYLEHRLEGEVFAPGDYYNKDRNDVAVFARYSVTLSW